MVRLRVLIAHNHRISEQGSDIAFILSLLLSYLIHWLSVWFSLIILSIGLSIPSKIRFETRVYRTQALATSFIPLDRSKTRKLGKAWKENFCVFERTDPLLPIACGARVISVYWKKLGVCRRFFMGVEQIRGLSITKVVKKAKPVSI